jgi:hypothetical protein
MDTRTELLEQSHPLYERIFSSESRELWYNQHGLFHWLFYASASGGHFYYQQGLDPFKMRKALQNNASHTYLYHVIEMAREQYQFDLLSVPLDAWADEPGETPKHTPYPSLEQMEKHLTDAFVDTLLHRDTASVQTIIDMFAAMYYEWFCVLGPKRQDNILRAAQRSTGIDLSQWIDDTEEEKENGI